MQTFYFLTNIMPNFINDSKGGLTSTTESYVCGSLLEYNSQSSFTYIMLKKSRPDIL